METVNDWERDFAEFFQQVTGFTPFRWQTRLASIALAGEWPHHIHLPTGVGKSSLVVIWAYALARDLAEPKDHRSTPMRLIYVVDRRLIVDAVDEQAQAMAQILENPKTVRTKRLADALRPYPEAPPLHVMRARGGVPHNTLWPNAPRQPAILTGTVDQTGSRLLFRGYGLSAKQRPIHAGLLGVDTLFVVDEAHLSTPFVQTLLAVREGQQRREERVGLRPVKMVTMSATLALEAEVRDPPPFVLTAADTEELTARLVRPKWMVMESSVNMDKFFVNTPALRKSILTQVHRMTTDLGSGLGAIVVNHVASARAVFEDLRKQQRSGDSGSGKIIDVVLLTGRVRPYDRDAILARWIPRMRAGRGTGPVSEGLVWIVATQTVEVGADFDFDALITESAPLSAIQQRLGRLNRLGRLKSGIGAVVRPERAPGIYSDGSLRATWEWLCGSANSGYPSRDRAPVVNDAIVINGAFLALTAARAQSPPRGVEDPSLDAPILQLPHLEAWTQTDPPPVWEPDIIPFLHGKQQRLADVHVVWREDFTEDLLLRASQDLKVAEDITNFLAWVPPVTRESLDLPVWAVRQWLQGEEVLPLLADFDGEAVEGSDSPDNNRTTQRMAWRWAGNQSAAVPPQKIRPGDTIVVPATYGGADAWGLNWESLHVHDVGDYAGPPDGRRHLRLTRTHIRAGIHETLAREVPWEEAWNDLVALWAMEISTQEMDDALRGWLGLMIPIMTESAQMLLKECLAHLNTMSWYPYPSSLGDGLVILWYVEPTRSQGTLVDPWDEEDTNCWGDHPSPTLPTLREHQDAVAAWISLYAEQGVLPERLIETVRLSGKYHDLGKLDPRFQVMMHGGDVVAATAAAEPVAKSQMDPRDRETRERARRMATYPLGQRHEELSVRLVQSIPLEATIDETLPLLWHLIGSHHGWGRPWFPMSVDQQPISIDTTYEDYRVSANTTATLGALDSGWVDQFDQLQAHYGYWGLAYLEAILRCADYQASATKGGPR